MQNLEQYYIDFADHTAAMEGIIFDDKPDKIARKTKDNTVKGQPGADIFVQTKYGSQEVGMFRKINDAWVDRVVSAATLVPKKFDSIVAKFEKMVGDIENGIKYADSKFDEYSTAVDAGNNDAITKIDADFRRIFVDLINYNRTTNAGKNEDFKIKAVEITDKQREKMRSFLTKFKATYNSAMDGYSKKAINIYYSKSKLARKFTRRHSKAGDKLWLHKECALYANDLFQYITRGIIK